MNSGIDKGNSKEDVKISVYQGLKNLPENISDIWRSKNNLDFDSRFEWYLLFEKHFSPSNYPYSKHQYLYISISIEKELIAIVPLIYFEKSIIGFKVRSIRSLGNFFSNRFQLIPLFDKKKDENRNYLELWQVVFGFIKERYTPDKIDLQPLINNSDEYSVLKSVDLKKGFFVNEYYRFANWIHDSLGENFADYFNSIDSKTRNIAKRKRKQAERLFDVSIEIIDSVDGFERLFADYKTVYEKSWKKKEVNINFIEGFCRYMASKGDLRLGVVFLDGDPVAAQIWFITNKKANIFKLAYDENYKKNSVGTILTTALMERVIDIDKVEVIDYLSGDDKYKKDWMKIRREAYGIEYYNKGSFMGLLLTLRHVLLPRIFRFLVRK